MSGWSVWADSHDGSSLLAEGSDGYLNRIRSSPSYFERWGGRAACVYFVQSVHTRKVNVRFLVEASNRNTSSGM